MRLQTAKIWCHCVWQHDLWCPTCPNITVKIQMEVSSQSVWVHPIFMFSDALLVIPNGLQHPGETAYFNMFPCSFSSFLLLNLSCLEFLLMCCFCIIFYYFISSFSLIQLKQLSSREVFAVSSPQIQSLFHKCSHYFAYHLFMVCNHIMHSYTYKGYLTEGICFLSPVEIQYKQSVTSAVSQLGIDRHCVHWAIIMKDLALGTAHLCFSVTYTFCKVFWYFFVI